MSIRSIDQFESFTGTIQAQEGYESPVAFAFGVGTLEHDAATGQKEIIDVRYIHTNYEFEDEEGNLQRPNRGSAAVLSHVLGEGSRGLMTGGSILTPAGSTGPINSILNCFPSEYINAASWQNHQNIYALTELRNTGYRPVEIRKVMPWRSNIANEQVGVLGVIRNWEDDPVSIADAYLRLYALSERARKPNTVNIGKVFGILKNLVHTADYGVMTVERWDRIQKQLVLRGLPTTVLSVDKFPRMVDHVVPSGVRIADPSRVRLGAYLGEGTTVMHEGFVNFNAGTEGPNMVEGRISAGVFVGAHSEIGGGASIMGTLSGGGKEVITIGEHTLIGANGGTGISLGENCIVEAGTYVTPGKIVTMKDQDFRKFQIRARNLSGVDNLTFRTNSRTGELEAIPTDANWGGLNDKLHKNV